MTSRNQAIGLTTAAVACTTLLSSVAMGQVWVNGPIINELDVGCDPSDDNPDLGPRDVTITYTALGNIWTGLAVGAGFPARMADQFELCSQATITSMDLYVYQSGLAGQGTIAAEVPTITAATLQVWDGRPADGGASVLWGDTTTNVASTIVGAGVTELYKVGDGNLPSCAAPIVRVTVNFEPPLVLDPGIYWVDYDVTGDGVNGGPWIPPIGDPADANTGNCRQFFGGGWTYQSGGDGSAGEPGWVGTPFEVAGTGGTCAPGEEAPCPNLTQATALAIGTGGLPISQGFCVPTTAGGGGTCDGDLDGDNDVDVDDLLLVLGAWCPGASCSDAGDATGDGITNVDDLLVILGAWGPCPPGPDATSQYYAWTADEDGEVRLSGANATGEPHNWTYTIYEGVGGPVVVTSQGGIAEWVAASGTTYIIQADPGAVDGFYGQFDELLVDVRPPDSDEISGATEILAGSNAYDTTGATPAVAIESGCDTSGSGTTVVRDIWHYYQATDTGFLELAQCAAAGCGGSATFDTDLYIYGPFANIGEFPPDEIVNDPDALNVYLIACNDDALGFCDSAAGGWLSYLQVPVMTGETYLVRNGGWDAGNDFGTGNLEVCLTPGDLSQVCVGRVPVAINSVTAGDTSPTTVFDAQAAVACTVAPDTPGLWYSVIGDGTVYTATTCGVTNGTFQTDFDTILAIYCSGCATPVCVAGNDDDQLCFANFVNESTACWPTTVGVEYFVFVAGLGGNQGLFDLKISNDGSLPDCTPDDPNPVDCLGLLNDGWADAIAITEADFPLATDTLDATTDGPDHPACDSEGDGGVTVNDIWYQLTPGASGNLTISGCTEDGGDADYDTDLVLYDGCGDPTTLTVAQCNDDAVNPCTSGTAFGSRLENVPVTAGNCYQLRVGGWANDERGTATLAGSIAP